jgi:hypothetical protein
MKLIEQIRGEVVRKSIKQLGGSWSDRRAILLTGISNLQMASPQQILDIGDYLSFAFQLKQLKNIRDQAAVSAAGSAWADLVAVYINLVLAGTDAVALTRSFVPACVKEALKVTYRGQPAALQSDIDLMVLFVPGLMPNKPIGRARTAVTKAFSEACANRFGDLSVTLFQLKTNWNDTAQVPMLWNMIYNLTAVGKMPPNGFSVGGGRYHLNGLKSFSYGFVTVPTQSDLTAFKPTSMPVCRVAGCSGGAYWGRPTKHGVIKSIKEYFNHQYNYSNHHFPPPQSLGYGVCAAIQSPASAPMIDLAAFDLFHHEGVTG